MPEYVIREWRQERDLQKHKVWNWRNVGNPLPSKADAMKALSLMPEDYPRCKGRVIVERDNGVSREVVCDYYGRQ